MLQQNSPDLSIAKVWIDRELLQLVHFFFLLTILNLLWENEGVFHNPDEKLESLSFCLQMFVI